MVQVRLPSPLVLQPGAFAATDIKPLVAIWRLSGGVWPVAKTLTCTPWVAGETHFGCRLSALVFDWPGIRTLMVVVALLCAVVGEFCLLEAALGVLDPDPPPLQPAAMRTPVTASALILCKRIISELLLS